MFVLNFKILSQVVSEKSLIEKKLTNTHTHTHTQKHINRKGKNYIPPTYFVCPGYNKQPGLRTNKKRKPVTFYFTNISTYMYSAITGGYKPHIF